MKTARVEVWFSNGLFRAFPEVRMDTFKEKDDEISFHFKSDHVAKIMRKNIDFMEIMEE